MGLVYFHCQEILMPSCGHPPKEVPDGSIRACRGGCVSRRLKITARGSKNYKEGGGGHSRPTAFGIHFQVAKTPPGWQTGKMEMAIPS